ncbi:hypothetical protein ACT9XH_02005 [Methanococcoides methylutens]|uniref:hypothetical protein n=1 Tax=Methanococcoides methylutens TaxID=2226 RepID=UPI0040446A2B
MEDEKQKIFLELRSIVSSYVPPLVVRIDEKKHYDVYGSKTVQVGKTKKDGIYFASIIIQKYHVGFYFFPIYTHREKFNDEPEELMKLLKGKSCFHLKKFDESIFDDIKWIIDKGMEIYKEEGWV